MKYIIEFEDEPSMVEAGLRYYQCKQVPYWGLSPEIIKNLTPYTEPDREDIEDEVWEFAKKIGSFNGLSKHELDKCFGHTTIQGVMTTYDTYQEAKAKYEAWKKQKDEIHVGDEVKYFGCNYVVVYAGADEVYHLVDGNWIREVVQGEYKLTKTGRHFSEVEELLKKMRGEE